jgi:hypothetical protein
LVTHSGFEFTALMDQSSLTKFLNTIVGASAPQFYVPRLVIVKNEKDKGPPKGQPTFTPPPSPVPGAPATGAPPAPGAAPTPGSATSYIVGEEKLEVTLRLEIVDFAETASK